MFWVHLWYRHWEALQLGHFRNVSTSMKLIAAALERTNLTLQLHTPPSLCSLSRQFFHEQTCCTPVRNRGTPEACRKYGKFRLHTCSSTNRRQLRTITGIDATQKKHSHCLPADTASRISKYDTLSKNNWLDQPRVMLLKTKKWKERYAFE